MPLLHVTTTVQSAGYEGIAASTQVISVPFGFVEDAVAKFEKANKDGVNKGYVSIVHHVVVIGDE